VQQRLVIEWGGEQRATVARSSVLRDERTLAQALREAGATGFEPPAGTVLRAPLAAARLVSRRGAIELEPVESSALRAFLELRE
jgi:hypothetical protein